MAQVSPQYGIPRNRLLSLESLDSTEVPTDAGILAACCPTMGNCLHWSDKESRISVFDLDPTFVVKDFAESRVVLFGFGPHSGIPILINLEVDDVRAATV